MDFLDRTGSLLVAMLMHTSFTSSNVIFVPLATGVPLVIWSLVLAAALWVVVSVITVANRRICKKDGKEFKSQPLQTD